MIWGRLFKYKFRNRQNRHHYVNTNELYVGTFLHVSVIEDHHQVVYIYINLNLFAAIPPYTGQCLHLEVRRQLPFFMFIFHFSKIKLLRWAIKIV
jgi:hypothetical protein